MLYYFSHGYSWITRSPARHRDEHTNSWRRYILNISYQYLWKLEIRHYLSTSIYWLLPVWGPLVNVDKKRRAEKSCKQPGPQATFPLYRIAFRSDVKKHLSIRTFFWANKPIIISSFRSLGCYFQRNYRNGENVVSLSFWKLYIPYIG
jgi:hypothetical protein